MESDTSGPESVHPLLEQGIIFFNAGRFFDAHEAWEDLWRESRGPVRLYYQGLVQIAVGLHHLDRGNLSGGARVLERGLRKLEDAPSSYCGIDNSLLINDIRKVQRHPEETSVQIRRAG